MPLAPSTNRKHFFVTTMVSHTMWFFGYCGDDVSVADFALLCNALAHRAPMCLPGASRRCFAFKCRVIYISLCELFIVHDSDQCFVICAVILYTTKSPEASQGSRVAANGLLDAWLRMLEASLYKLCC